jgi:hypothetical protein
LPFGPLARTATPEDVARHGVASAALARYKLGRLTAPDADGYHRVRCPAVLNKVRCPLRTSSQLLVRDRPEITPPNARLLRVVRN